MNTQSYAYEKNIKTKKYNNTKEHTENTMTLKKEFFEKITKHLSEDSTPSAYINKLLSGGSLGQYPFTMLKKLEQTPQSPIHHPEGCVWNHVALVLDQAAQVRHLSHQPLVFMWAALLHDIGKSETTRKRKGRIVSYDHDTVGMDMTIKFLSALTDDMPFIQEVSKLVKYHMHPLYVNKNLPFGNVEDMKAETDLHEIALLGYCDRMGRLGSNSEEEKNTIKKFIQKCGVKDMSFPL